MTQLSDLHILLLEKGTLDCQDIEEAMCDYADDDLPESVKVRVDEHIDTCIVCKEFKESYLATIQIARSLKEEFELTYDAQNRLRERLSAKLGINLSIR